MTAEEMADAVRREAQAQEQRVSEARMSLEASKRKAMDAEMLFVRFGDISDEERNALAEAAARLALRASDEDEVQDYTALVAKLRGETE